jgi:methionine aminopeptidase
LVRRIIGDARYTPASVDNTSAMSIETEDELDGLRRAGHAVAVALRELRRRVQPGVTTRRAGDPRGHRRLTYRTADGALAAHAEHTILVTDGRPLVITA